jgi:hypothetical protein
MPSPVIIKVQSEPYLIKFMEKLYGSSPLNFPKKSNWHTMLEYFLDKPPMNWIEPDFGEATMQIQLPFLENKNVLSNHYLSPVKQRVLTDEMKRFFKITFRTELSKMIVMGLQRQQALEIFIEKYGLSMDCWDFLEKDYQRYLKLRHYHKQFRSSKNSSDKEVELPAVSLT